jgi:hypothetical protein
MRSNARPEAIVSSLRAAALALGLALGTAVPLLAGDGKWSFSLEPMYMEVYGHDRHVLTIHEIDFDTAPESDSRTAVNLDTDSEIAYRAEIQYATRRWTFGFDYFLLLTSQSTDDRAGSAGGDIDEVAFEVPGRSFFSTGPSEALYYRILEDTDLEMWTMDLYAMRALSESDTGLLSLQLGVRVADFDNDYHAAVGLAALEGRRIDSSSNYGTMPGPLVGLVGAVSLGQSTLQGYLGQSVVFGSAELSNIVADFEGPFSEDPAPDFAFRETFHADQNVAIPITEVRLKWIYRISDLLSLGAGVQSSTWWNVPVPPGVIPSEGTDAFDESTLVLFGAAAIVRIAF